MAIKGIVGWGSDIAFWLHIWVGDEPHAKTFPTLYALELQNGGSVLDRRMTGANSTSWRWCWKQPISSAAEVTNLASRMLLLLFLS
ncbi:hypothetical protein HanXRQr2_Chr09g0379031 [Helianthus annuus]|uniref:Uncharacterized protein n=1 Tax=Helianthus annuus TaxID=4232 RepID=A0A9K3I4Q2_HELAN|nr:hypothetical protein HanXRQr2_Chr09g0379031 [Helianthus annuus]